MKYTVRFAHLEFANVRPAQVVSRGQVIGKMGDSGQRTAAHLHIDCVEGAKTDRYTQLMIGAGEPNPSKKQLDYFIDEELFGIELVITTHYLDPKYQEKFQKPHMGYDVVPKDRHESDSHFLVRWNRSAPGLVTRVMSNDPGYGNCVYIVFDA